jgi:hypothetical protein
MIGEQFSGKFAWHDAEFAHQPEPRVAQDEDLPFDAWGPATTTISFRQYVFGREQEINEHIAAHKEMDLKTKGMMLSVRVLACEDKVIFDRNLFASGELTAQVPQ